MNDKENLMKEIRRNEALRKGYTGLNGKFGIIALYLGQELIEDKEGYEQMEGIGHTTNDLPDFYNMDYDYDDQLPTIESDVFGGLQEPYGDEWTPKTQRVIRHSSTIGWYFEGLKRGMHLEIKCIKDGEIVVTYKGNFVYREKSGDVIQYRPDEEWEEKIERLYVMAKQIQGVAKVQDQVVKKEQAKKEKLSWLEQMKELWGL